MLGRTRRSEPVFMKTVATSCAGISVYIERMIAMSSTYWPVLLNTSLTSMPAWPILLNLNGEPMATPPSGIVCPSIWLSAGFGSQVSTWEGAPWAKMWMTALALAGKGGSRGAMGFVIEGASMPPSAKRSIGSSMAARLNAPIPSPTRLRNWRRVRT